MGDDARGRGGDGDDGSTSRQLLDFAIESYIDAALWHGEILHGQEAVLSEEQFTICARKSGIFI